MRVPVFPLAAVDRFVEDVLRLDARRQAMFRIALAQTVLPVLAGSKNYGYAVQAVGVCWRWAEQRDVDGMTLYYLFHDDEDHGVETAMHAAHAEGLGAWNAWGCVAEALAYTGSCAFESEGSRPPEFFENAFPDELVAEFLGHYRAVAGQNLVPQQLAEFLNALPDDQLTRSIVDAKAEELARAASHA